MNNKIKADLKNMGFGYREVNNFLHIIKIHPPTENLSTATDVINYCEEYIWGYFNEYSHLDIWGNWSVRRL